MATHRSLHVVARSVAVFCCLATAMVVGQNDNQGIYRRCSDGRSVAVPCLQPSTVCTDRSVPSRIPGSCVRWYSCCKEPPKDVNYLRSPEEKAAHRDEMYQKAVSWLVAGARAIKNVWGSLVDRVRGDGGSGQQDPPYGSQGQSGVESQRWRGAPHGGDHPSQERYWAGLDSQRPSSRYGPPSEKSPSLGPAGTDWLTNAKDLSSRYESPTLGSKPQRGERDPLSRPSWPRDGFTTPPRDSHLFTRPNPDQFESSGAGIPKHILPPTPDTVIDQRPVFPTPTSLDGADAIVAEAARRWLPTDCGRLSATRSVVALGRRRRRRDITGGHPADRSRWAWMAIIGMRRPGENWAENRGQGPVWICGGTVVTRQFVLTAAHCVGGRTPDKLVVRLGEYNLSSSADGPHQDQLVSEVTLHPQFVSRQNDVALLRLIEPAKFGLTVRPACLPVPGSPAASAGLRRVAGWGRLSFEGAGAAVLQEAKLTPVSADVCEAIYRRLSSFGDSFPGGGFLGTKLCAVDPSSRGADACLGDSGGPLTALRDDGRFSLVGIVSLGVGCGDPDFPGVYTRVESYVPWIVAVIAKAEAELTPSAA